MKSLHLAAALAGLVALAISPFAAAAPASIEPAALATIQKGYIAAWNAADAKKISTNFIADGDFINPTGFHARGPTEIEAFYAQAFAAGYAHSKATFTPRVVRMIAPGVAAIDGEWTISGARKPTGQSIPDESGIANAIVVKTPRGWKVSLLREQSSATKITP